MQQMERSRKLLKPGFIYLMQCGDRYKLGCSGNPNRRLIQVQWGCSAGWLRYYGFGDEPIALLHTIPTNNMRIAEGALLTAFANHRIGMTEWFVLEVNEIALICSLSEINVPALPLTAKIGPGGRKHVILTSAETSRG